MKRSVLSIFCLIILFAGGCAKPVFLVPDYPQKQPRSVAVLPVELASEREVIPLNVESVLRSALKGRGYEAIRGDSGYADDPQKLCRDLNVDAVLKSRLNNYESTYKVIYRSTKLNMDLYLIDGKNGDILWQGRVDTSATTFGLLSAAMPHPIEEWVKSGVKSLPKAKK